MKPFWISLGALLAGLAVAAGAFGAHGLKTWVDQGRLDTQQLINFETAVRYQMYHAYAIIIVGMLNRTSNRPARLSPWAFVVGIVLFCGGLYFHVLARTVAPEMARVLVRLVPIGGLAFLTGWVALAVNFFREARVHRS